MSWAITFGIYTGLTAVYAAALSLIARVLGACPTEVAVFQGPRLFGCRIGRTEWRLNLIPLGARVLFGAPRPESGSDSQSGLDPARVEELARIHEEFHAKPLFVQALMNLSGPVSMVLIAACFLGPSEGMSSLSRGFAQVFQGAWSPFEVGAPLIQGFLDLVARGGALSAAGILSAKLAALNLLPIPMLAGGQVLALLLVGRRTPPLLIYAQWLGLLLLVIVYTAWGIALVRVALGGI